MSSESKKSYLLIAESSLVIMSPKDKTCFPRIGLSPKVSK